MQAVTATSTEYAPNEALTGRMTAEEWTERFEPAVLKITYDRDECLRDIAAQGDQEAQRLNIPYSTTGHYPPFVWELAALRNR